MEINIDYQLDWMENYSRDASEHTCEGLSGRGELWHSHDL